MNYTYANRKPAGNETKDPKTIPDPSHLDALRSGSAVPTPEHFLPLLCCLGVSEGETPMVFNNHCELGAIAMTGYAFGL